MVKFAWGFKKDCERLVASIREELRVPESGPIDMAELANHLEIPLAAFATYVKRSGLICDELHLAETYRKVSAFTLFEGRRRTIVYNEKHSLARHRSDLGHELAHALLHHPPEGTSPPAIERLHEAEAAWLGGVLLLTDLQAARIAKWAVPYDAAMARYGISREMLVYRMRVTGALKRFPSARQTAA